MTQEPHADGSPRLTPPGPWLARAWGLIVAFLYGLLLLLLLPPLVLVGFVDENLRRGQSLAAILPEWLEKTLAFYTFSGPEDSMIFCGWALVALLFVSQIALLALPVRRVTERPVKKRHVAFPVIAAAIAMSLLVIGGLASLWELVFGNNWPSLPDTLEEMLAYSPYVVVGLSWLFFMLLFGTFARCEKRDCVQMAVSWLLRGSAMELIIALPCHVVARCRNYCCAGFMTFTGIVFGISVMLFAFGPGVFFLFYERWQRKTRGTAGPDTKAQ